MHLTMAVLTLAGFLPAVAQSGRAEAEVDGSRQEVPEQGALENEQHLSRLIEQLPDASHGAKRVGKEVAYQPAVGELRAHLRAGKGMSGERWRQALLGTGALRYRKRWPADLPIAISMRSPYWLGVAEIRVNSRTAWIADARCGNLFSSYCGNAATWVYEDALYQELGTLPIGEHNLEFNVEVERGKSWFDSEFWRGSTGREPTAEEKRAALEPEDPMMGKFRLAFQIEIVPTLDDAIPPKSGEATDEAVRDSISLAFANRRVDGGRRLVPILVIDPDAGRYPLLASLGLSLQVEFLKDSKVIDESHILVGSFDDLALTSTVSGGRQVAFLILHALPAALNSDGSDNPGWAIRVTGSSEQVLTLWEAASYWSGRLEFSVDEAITREKERAPAGREFRSGFRAF